MIEKKYSSDVYWDDFTLSADNNAIASGGIDATRVIFGVTDKYRNFRPYGDGMVEFSIEGPGEIIGDIPFDLSENGGCGAIWIKSKGKSAGVVTLRAKTLRYGIKSITINIE